MNMWSFSHTHTHTPTQKEKEEKNGHTLNVNLSIRQKIYVINKAAHVFWNNGDDSDVVYDNTQHGRSTSTMSKTRWDVNSIFILFSIRFRSQRKCSTNRPLSLRLLRTHKKMVGKLQCELVVSTNAFYVFWITFAFEKCPAVLRRHFHHRLQCELRIIFKCFVWNHICIFISGFHFVFFLFCKILRGLYTYTSNKQPKALCTFIFRMTDQNALSFK